MDVPVSRGGLGRPDGRFHAQGKARRGCGTTFFIKAVQHPGQPPETITPDEYAASQRAVRKMIVDGLLPEGTKVQSSKLNNLIE
jgi:hypothetical protein